MGLLGKQKGYGTLRHDLPWLKDAIDYRLARHPKIYLLVDRFRSWINWDRRVYLSFVGPGHNVLDIGANVGAHTLFLSHLVGADGRVFAFEPLQRNVDALHATLRRRARFANTSVLTFAVGDPKPARQEVLIRVPGDDLTQASLMPQSAGSWERNPTVTEQRVVLTSIDAEPAVQTLPHLDFVKIDVEGAELNVLQGARRTLMTHLPIVYSELYERWTSSFGYTPGEVFDFARSLGYEAARVISRGGVYPVVLGAPVAAALFETSADVLFFARSHRRQVVEFDRRYLPTTSR